MMPSARKNANRPAVKKTTWIACDTTITATTLTCSASDSGVRAGLSAEQLAHFAELVFAYIDQLSAASVAGHSDELATTGRVRERYRERLANVLLSRASQQDKVAAAERAVAGLGEPVIPLVVLAAR